MRGRRRRLARVGELVPAVAAVAALGLLAASCGGSSSEGVARIDSTTTTTETGSSSTDDPQQAFVDCMRENGAPDFPEPDSQGRFNLTPQVPRQTPGLAAAHEACASLKGPAYALDPSVAEGRRQKQQTLLDYAACMRSHGVPNFPDPTELDGGFGFDLPGSGINPSSPAFSAAEEACSSLAGAPQPKQRR
jgi:hypothetical protein